ncbi:MAG: hypothetical protein WKF96_15180 [Solirubrobacteraceae bacterium]
MSLRRLTVVIVVGASLGAPAAAPAAWFPGPEIVSVDNPRQEQADGATSFADLSDDGRYVVLQTRATNFFPDGDKDPPGGLRQGGVFRYDRQTGEIALVADGDVVSDPGGILRQRGAANPSTSADGSVVVFSTAQPLVPQDTNDNIDVYARKMSIPLQADRAASGAYELVSALDGTELPPSYEPRDPPLSGQNPGTNVFPGTAISADGRFVALRTVEQRSDLAGNGPLLTPAGAVFVRDLRGRRTTLVSRASSDGSPVGGSEAPVVLSADGSTVSWAGNFAPQQTRFIDGELLDTQIPYYLWRRWADLGATTRRVTGLADPDDPACPPNGRVTSDPAATGPCFGPLISVDGGSIASRAPALSADGRRVAFLTASSSRPLGDGIQGLDLFLTDMSPGITRKQGTRQLTADTAGAQGRANPEIESVAMNAQGTRLAFVSARSAFILPRPVFQGLGRNEPGPVELFTLDIAADTIERVVFAPGGGDAGAAIQLNPTLSGDGRLIAFTTRAANLLSGDANELADAFVARFRPPAAGGGAPAGLNRRPPSLLADAVAEPELTVRASRRKDGAVLLRVRSPAAGRLEAIATTRARPKPPRRKAPKSAKKARRVARATRTLTKAGTVILVLKVSGKDGRRIRSGFSLTADVDVRLTPRPSGERLTADEEITFRGTPAKKKK